MDLFVGIMAIIVIGAGIMGWWMENGSNKEDVKENTIEEEQKKKTGGAV